MNKAVKYRIYPTQEQAVLLHKTFGCCRFVYNQMLTVQTKRYQDGEAYLSKFDAFQYMTANLKKEFTWLKEVDSQSLMNSVFSLDHAFMRFFRKQGKFPRYKSRKNGRYSYTTNCTNQNVVVGEYHIKLPKLGKVKAKIHRTVPEDWKLKSATISCDSTGAYYCSVLYEYEAEIQPVTAKEENVIGLDYKTSCLYADSNGNTADMPKYYKKSHSRLARAQRKLRNKTKGSRNYRKQMKKCNKIQKHIADQRKDFLHKKSAEITNQYDLVCIEDLSIREQLKGRKYRNFRKSTLDNGWYALPRCFIIS